MSISFNLPHPGGKGGKEVIAILKQIDPEVKAIVSSGYASDQAAPNCTDYGFVAACAKPYLLSKMQGIIERFVCP